MANPLNIALRGRTVGLRPIEEVDLELLADLANHYEVRGMVVGWGLPVTKSGQREWLANLRESPDAGRLCVVDLASGEAIGMAGLHHLDWPNRIGVTGTKIHPDLSRKGSGTDAVMLVSAWAFYEVGMRRLNGSMLESNHRSMATHVRKAGWTIDGVERQAAFRGGQFLDVVRVSVTREGFDAHPDGQEYASYVCPVDTTVRPDVDFMRAHTSVPNWMHS